MVIKKYYFKKIKSTNDQALKMIKKGLDKGIIITDKQTAGRGQHGKKWISLKGNLFMSVFFKINKHKKLSKITISNCKIIKNTLQKYVHNKLTIKHPNDILINGEKICGILQETVFFKLKKLLIVGIGVNIKKSPKIQNYKTSFLNRYSAKNIDKTVVFKSISKSFEKNIKL